MTAPPASVVGVALEVEVAVGVNVCSVVEVELGVGLWVEVGLAVIVAVCVGVPVEVAVLVGVDVEVAVEVEVEVAAEGGLWVSASTSLTESIQYTSPALAYGDSQNRSRASAAASDVVVKSVAKTCHSDVRSYVW
jgi:hypothetical protein